MRTKEKVIRQDLKQMGYKDKEIDEIIEHLLEEFVLDKRLNG